MTKMSGTQRTAILDFHNGVTDKRHTMLVRSYRTLGVMVANGWAERVTSHTGNVTMAGLIAAGVDMDAIHAEALAMDLAAAQAESDAIDAIEGDDPPMHFRADGSLHTGLTGVPQDRSDDGVPEVEQRSTPAPAPHTPDNPGYGRTVHFEHEGRVVSGTVRGIVFGGGLHRVTVFSADLGHTHTIDHGVTIDVADLLPAPEIEQCDDCESTGQNCWVHGVRKVTDATMWSANDPAPTLADDVTALRDELRTYRSLIGPIVDRSSARLDRIAGAVPVPTRVWMHRCGVVLINDTEPPPCHVCVSTPQISFVRLYSLGEVR